MLKKIRFFILPALLFSFLFSMPNVGGKYWMVPSNVALWLSAGFFIFLTLVLIVRKQKLYIAPTQKYIFVLLISLLVFGSFNSQLPFDQLIIYWLAFGFIALFYFMLGQFNFTTENLYQFIFAVVMFGGAQSLIGIIQIYDEQYRLFHLWFGYEPFRIVGAATGSFQQPNMMASFLSLSLIGSFILLYSSASFSITTTKKVVILISSILMFFIILFSGSRAAMLAFVIPFVLFLLVYFRRIYSQPINLILMISALAIAWFILWYINESFSGLEHISNKMVRIAEGGDTRIHLYSSAISMFFESPWFGYGIGGYQEAFHAFYAGKELPAGLSESEFSRMTHPHNELLFWMLQSGAVALIAVVVFIFLFIKRIFRVSDNAVIIMLLILPIVIQTMFSYPFGLSALHLFLLLILLSFGDEFVRVIKINVYTRVVLFFASLLLIIFLAISAFKTYKSIYETHYFYNRMYLYNNLQYKGFEEKGYFLDASSHPLFKDFVIEAMDKMLQNAIKENNDYDLRQYRKWCDNNKYDYKESCIELKR